MRRIVLGLFLVVLASIIVDALWGEDVLVWTWIIGFGVGSIAKLFWPKRGVQYAYRNWYRLHGFIIFVVFGGGFLGGIYLLARLLPRGMGEEMVTLTLAMLLGVDTIFLLIYFSRLKPPTQRKGWLRRRYPAVAKAIQRYRQPGDLLEEYFPALLIDGKRYFHISYYDESSGQIRGFLLLDEGGHVVEDPGLFERAAECKVLALEVIDYDKHQERARNMEEYQGAVALWQEIAERFVAARERFAALGPQALRDWQVVVETQELGRRVVEATIGMNVLQAEWAARLGLGRLTEVRHEEVEALEAEIHKVRQPIIEQMPELQGVAEPARRLWEAVRSVDGWKEKKVFEPWLESVLKTGVEIKGAERYTYAQVPKNQWKAWRERTAYALGLDGSEWAAEAEA